MKTPSPVSRSRKEARAAYDRMSRWYDWLAGSEQAYNRRGLELLGLSKGERVLEIGFGTGKTLAEMAATGAKVAGVDISMGMARVASEHLRKKMETAQVLPGLGDAARLPFADGSFDAVFCAFTLELFDTPEIPVVLGEVRRVLRENGRLGVVSLSLPDQPGAMVRIYEWFHRVLPAYVDCRPIPVVALIRQNGFRVRREECKNMWGLPVEIVTAVPGDDEG